MVVKFYDAVPDVLEDIESFEDELHYEIEEIILTDKLNIHWTFKEIMPHLLEEAKKREFICNY